MPSRSLDSAFERLRIALGQHDEAGLPDARLLANFVNERDQASFAIIVRRHARVVMGVCRRILRNEQDAEDAFQATFLVLVRKAASIAQPQLLAHWLYRVAHKTALKAHAVARIRQAREGSLGAIPEPALSGGPSRHDLAPFLDQELNRLPEKYRVPIILCDLEGKTHKKAAALLGCPEKTLSSRLARGREMLAKRLTRLGLAVSAATLPNTLTQNVAIAGPTLISATVKSASLLATGSAASGAISANVVTLMEGVIHAMFFKKIKVVCTALLVLSVAGYGGTKVAMSLGAGQGGTAMAQGANGVQGDKRRDGATGQGKEKKEGGDGTPKQDAPSAQTGDGGKDQNEVYIYKAVYIRAREAAVLIKNVFGGAKMGITTDDRTNTLIMNGTSSLVTQAKKVLQNIDVGKIPVVFGQEEPKAETFVYKCVHISARDAEKTVRSFVNDRGGVTVTADERSNTLFIKSTAENIAQAKTVLAQIDVEAAESPRQNGTPADKKKGEASNSNKKNSVFARKSPESLAGVATELRKAREDEIDLKSYDVFFSRLVMTDVNDQEAYMRQAFGTKGDFRVKANDVTLNYFPLLSEKGETILKAYVLRVDLHDVYIQVKDGVYEWSTGSTVENALEHALTAAKLKELGLDKLIKPFDPKTEKAHLGSMPIEARLKKAKEMGADFHRLKLAEVSVLVEMLTALEVRMRQMEGTRKLFHQGYAPLAAVNAANLAVEKAKLQYEQFEGY